MFRSILIVGLGSFLGGSIRFLSSHVVNKFVNSNFPMATLAVNLVGCLLLGIFYGLFEKGNIMSAELRLFLTVGFCGGFTTFSAFSNDTMKLAGDSQMFQLMLYMGISIFAGILMVYLGKKIVF